MSIRLSDLQIAVALNKDQLRKAAWMKDQLRKAAWMEVRHHKELDGLTYGERFGIVDDIVRDAEARLADAFGMSPEDKAMDIKALREALDLLVSLKVKGLAVDDSNPFIGTTCVVRTYSAGVHIGKVVSVKGKEVYLKNALRLWQWKDGGLSLSAVAQNGIKKGRLNRTGEILLTEAIELIPTNEKALCTFEKWVEDDE